jgi:methyl-accepting chemotaxis protein
MSLRIFRELRLSTQLYALVAISLLLSGALISYSILQVKNTQGTLKFTVDNRMASMASLNEISEALMTARASATDVLNKIADPDEANSKITAAISKAHDEWDQYFLAKMIPEEQTLADATTPLLDKAYGAIDKLQEKLKSKDLSGLADLRSSSLTPAVDAARTSLDLLSKIQMKAANLDEENARAEYQKALRNSALLLVGGALLLCGAAFLTIRAAMKKLGADPTEAAAVARRIAEGDLMFELKGKGSDADSLMAALSRMKGSLLHSKLDYEGQIDAISRTQGVVEFSPTGEILSANERFLEIVGYGLDALKGKHHSMLLSAAERANPAYLAFWDRMGRGEFRSGTFPRQTRDGREIWIHANYNPINDATGRPFKIVKYCTDVTAERHDAQMNAAFKGALSKLSANVMVAATDGQIVFANPAVVEMMTNAQSDIRKDIPAFTAAKMVGENIDIFHKNPARQRGMLEGLKDTHTAQVVVGGRTMKLIVNPMLDDTGRRLGTVVEWSDRTQEVATEAEFQRIVTAVSSGDLVNRISLSGKSGFFETLSKNINELVDNVAEVVQEVDKRVSEANSGDLTKRMIVDGRSGLVSKFGTGINELTASMASLVASVKVSANEVHRGADEISVGNSNLSQRTEEQASSLEETASSMEQMTSTVKQNADNASQASQLALAAKAQAEKGGAVVSQAIHAMSEINESSTKIADIIGVIDEIAFQTNLLALNAAVEAARAGEQGRGFAVVATEVRNLAGRSATAAKEIKTLIQDSVKKVHSGSELVSQSGATLESIVSSVKKVTDIVSEIAMASHEQSAGIEQVNKAVMQLDELTQQNAALVEESTAASQSMADQARSLNETLARYKVSDDLMPGTHSGSTGKVAGQAAERRTGNRPWSGKLTGASLEKSPSATPSNRESESAAVLQSDAVWKGF